jgi:DNA-binding transcriptional regulator YiaG
MDEPLPRPSATLSPKEAGEKIGPSTVKENTWRRNEEKDMIRLAELKHIDTEAVARAIEADAGEPVSGIREALTDARAGRFARVTTPAQMLMREARRKTGLTRQEFARVIEPPSPRCATGSRAASIRRAGCFS